MKKTGFFIVCITLIMFCSTGLIAEEHKKHDDHQSSHSFHTYHLALFGGFTSNLDAKHTDFSIGADLEYRLSEKFGVGVLVDMVLADHTETIIEVFLAFHPADNIKLFLAPGFAFAKHEVHEDEHHSEEHFGSLNSDEASTTSIETASHFAFRLGASYDFHIGKLSISPTISADFINSTVSLVYGVAIGIGF